MARATLRLTVDDLTRRATGGKRLDKDRMLRPSMTYHLLNDPFWIWCGYHAPNENKVEEESRYDEMKMDKGAEFEEEWVRKRHPEAQKVKPEYGIRALKETVRLMREGAPAIHQPQLWDLSSEVYGKGDLLIRDASHPSDLGQHHYRVVEVKQSKTARDYHVAQALLYNGMLGRIQGYTPPEVTIVLRESEKQVSCSKKEAAFEKWLNDWRAIRAGKEMPDPPGWEKTDSPWRVYANKVLKERLDLTLLPGVGPSGRAKLRKLFGVESIRDLYEIPLKRFTREMGETSGVSLYNHVQAYRLGKPIPVRNGGFTLTRRRRNIHFDFETSDEVHPTEPSHVYLIGAIDEATDGFAYFLAKGAAEEEKMFRDFLDYVGNPEEAILYHWTDFEIGEVKGVMKRYPRLQPRLQALIDSCVDLKEAVASQFYLPVPTYSIKSVAPFLGFDWRQEDVGAFESMVLYWDYLEGDEEGIKKAVLYNEDDVRAMVHVVRSLSGPTG